MKSEYGKNVSESERDFAQCELIFNRLFNVDEIKQKGVIGQKFVLRNGWICLVIDFDTQKTKKPFIAEIGDRLYKLAYDDFKKYA